MDINGSVALVTGANRGIGRAFARALIDHGGAGTTLLEGTFDHARRAMEVNYLGTWAVSRAFAPVLARNGGGALVNMLSVASWVGRPLYPGYAASKAAQWSLTNSLRQGLREQGTLVVGVHAGFVDTDFSAWTDTPKISAVSVAEQTIQALANDWAEVLADENTRQVKAALSQPPSTLNLTSDAGWTDGS